MTDLVLIQARMEFLRAREKAESNEMREIASLITYWSVNEVDYYKLKSFFSNDISQLGNAIFLPRAISQIASYEHSKINVMIAESWMENKPSDEISRESERMINYFCYIKRKARNVENALLKLNNEFWDDYEKSVS